MIPQSISGRRLIFTRRDAENYCDLLVEACPDLRFVAEPNDKQKLRAEEPEVRCFQHIREAPNGWLDLYVAPPGWEMRYERRENNGRGRWGIAENSIVFPSGRWERTREQEEWVEYGNGERIHPHVGSGRIWFRARTGVEEDRKLTARLLRLVSKVAVAKCQLEFPGQPGREPTRYDKGSPYWVGHQAVEWVKAHPDRVLDQGPAHHGSYIVMPYDGK